MAAVGFPVSLANGLPRHTVLEGATVRTSSDQYMHLRMHANFQVTSAGFLGVCMSGFRHTLFDHLYRATVDSSTSISGHRFFFQGYDRVYQKMTVDSLPGCSLVSYLIA